MEGREYESTRIAFFTIIYPETLQFAEQHPVDSPVSVRYDPEKPAESVVIPGLNPIKPYSDIVLAVCGVVVGTGVAIGLYTGLIG